MAFDLVIDIENTPGALARVATAISDAGVNIAAATCIGNGERLLMPGGHGRPHPTGRRRPVSLGRRGLASRRGTTGCLARSSLTWR